MMIAVERRWFTKESTIGKMYLNGAFFCFTLEPVTRADDVKPRAIPEGTYSLTMRPSEKFNGKVMPHVENVLGFEGILIHNGNYPHDTEGCCLVGSTMSNDFVGNSVVTLAKLLHEIESSPAPHIIRYLSAVIQLSQRSI